MGGAENAGVDNVAPSSRGEKRGEIWRPKKNWNMLNDKRIKAYMTRCDNGAYMVRVYKYLCDDRSFARKPSIDVLKYKMSKTHN